jgi:uncharacterized protein (DUF1499 family)
MAFWCVAAGFALALISVAAALLSGIGYQRGLWHFRTGFRVLRWSFYGGVSAAVLSLAGVLLSSPRDAAVLAMAAVGIGIGGLMAYVPWRWKRIADSLPYIHDITTDVGDPPDFVAVAALRGPDDHPVAYDGPDVAAQQRKAYPDLATFYTRAPRQAVLDAAQAVVAGMGLQVVDVDPAQGRIEATQTSRFYGFKDDLVVRVREKDGRVAVDLRSKSRVGRSDMGQNAKRIREFIARLKDALGAGG